MSRTTKLERIFYLFVFICFYTCISVTFTLTFLWKRHHADCVVFWGKVMERSLPARPLLKSGDGAAREWEVRERGKLRLLSKSWQRTESLRWTKRGKVEGWGASARREVQQKESCRERSEKPVTITWFFPFSAIHWFSDRIIRRKGKQTEGLHIILYTVKTFAPLKKKKKAAKSQLTGDLFIYLFTCLLIYTTH